MILFATFGSKRASVASVEEAAVRWRDMRMASGAGVSTIGNGIEVSDDSDVVVARISYNGRIWNPDGTPYATQVYPAWNDTEDAEAAIRANESRVRASMGKVLPAQAGRVKTIGKQLDFTATLMGQLPLF